MGNQQSALLEAASRGDTTTCRLLASDPRTHINTQDKDGWNALHYASAGGHSEAVADLLAHGAQVQPDCQGRLPLHLAALSGESDTVAVLLHSSRAEVDARDVSGCTSLHRAAAQGHEGAVQVLLQHGAAASLAFQGGTTAAHLAAWKGREHALQALLRAGADPDARDADGATPLHDAAGGAACSGCLHALLAAGADPRARTKSGQTPAQLAAAKGADEAAALLRRAEAGGVRPGPRLGSAGGAAPSAPPLPLPLQRGGPAAFVAYPRLHGAREPDSACPHQSAAGVAEGGGAAHGGVHGEQADGGFAAMAAAVASAAWLPVCAAADLAGHAAGWARWATAWDHEGGGNKGDADECAGRRGPAEAKRGSSPELLESSAAERERAGGSGCEAASTGRARAEGPARGRFGLPPGGDQDDSDGDDGPKHAPGLHIFTTEELGLVGINAPQPARLDAGCVGGAVVLGAHNGSPAAVWVLPVRCGGERGRGPPCEKGRNPPGDSGRDPPGEEQLLRAAGSLTSRPGSTLARLLGACPEAGALVYELPQAGSLLDALHSRAPPGAHHPVRLDWVARVRIAAQVARGLDELHEADLSHGAVRPSMVLLQLTPDVMGGADAQLATAPAAACLCGLHMAVAASAPAAYMPPECAAGQPPRATADVFALGLLLLQLLAASEADGLAAHAAATLESGGIERLIDPCAGAWPPVQAARFARLALSCMHEAESARPSVPALVLPELERLLALAEAGTAAKKTKGVA